jgi:predicted amidohydrolase YtcJ
VLEQNLFDVAPDDVADVKVVATIMGGKIMHRAGL